MTTTRQKCLMLAAIFGLAAVCGWEVLGLHAWNTLAFGVMAVACAAMFAWQVGGERMGRRGLGVWVNQWKCEGGKPHTLNRRWIQQKRFDLHFALGTKQRLGWKWRAR
jgi:hypothetical protein